MIIKYYRCSYSVVYTYSKTTFTGCSIILVINESINYTKLIRSTFLKLDNLYNDYFHFWFV